MVKSYKEYLRKTKRKKMITLFLQIFILISFIFLWEIFTRVNLLNPFLVSSPLRIIELLIEMIKSGELFPHILVTTKEMFFALVLSSISGIIIASILYLFPRVNDILDPYLITLNAIPKTALGPILIIYFGTNEKGIISIAISFSIIITVLSCLSYFNNVDKNLIKMMKVLNANRLQLLLKVVFPSSFEGLLSQLKVNIGLSWVGVIVGEFLVSRKGIGYLLMYGGQTFKLDLVMLGIIILSIITLLLNIIISLLIKRRH